MLENYEYERLKFLLDLKNKVYLNDNKAFVDELIQNKKTPIPVTMKDRYEMLYELYEVYDEFKNKYTNTLYYKREKKMIEDLMCLYLPLSRYLYKQPHPTIFGIQAHQGCGKTTVCEILSYLLKEVYFTNCATISIDDLYLTHKELKELKRMNPKLKFRGPPGTHDLKLATDVLDKVKNLHTYYEIPRYDKRMHHGLGDRSEEGFKVLSQPVDVLLFEGWFLGVEPVEQSKISSILQELINQHLNDYIPLWNYVDNWLIMQPKKFKYSRKWRYQAEKKNKQGMDYKTMQKFLDYFWECLPPDVYFKDLGQRRSAIATIIIDKHRNFLI